MIKRLLVFCLCMILGMPVLAADAPPHATQTKMTTTKTVASRSLEVTVDHGINLTLSSPATSVFIANPDIADVQVMSPTSIMIFGKRTGETTFMATDSTGRTLEQRTVSVTQDLSFLSRELAEAIPGSKIRATALPNGIILTGEAKDAAAVTDAYKLAMRYLSSGGDIINRVRVMGSNQIQIRVRFAEVQKNIDNTLGIDWGSALSFGGFVLGVASGNPVTNILTGATNSYTNTTTNSTNQNAGAVTPLNANSVVTSPFGRASNPSLATPNNLLSFSRAGEHFNINNVIDALAQDGLITILAEPNLTAMSGETANFLAGGEFPIPIPQGNGTISVEFKNYGISLAFTPTLVGENRINLHVKPEVSELSTLGSVILDNISIPALTTRKAETTVEVASGQSFAIAGLLDNSQTQTVNKYPILGDMPILGALFRSNHFQSGQTELVIIITPYIVRPNGEQQLALPTDGFSPPSEADRILKLRYNSSDPNQRTSSGQPTAVLASPVAPVAAGAPILPDDPGGSGSVEPMVVAPNPAPPETVPLTPIAASGDAVIHPAASAPPAPQAPPTSIVPSAPTALPAPTMPSLHINPARAAPVNLSPDGSAPSGPGGFIME